MSEPSHGEVVRNLHKDLARRYRLHKSSLINFWRSFDSRQRARCMKAGAKDGAVLRHSLDASLGNVYKFIPEWNLRDITAADSDLLLTLLEYRATTSLYEQYAGGLGDALGDRDHIAEMMRTKGLRHVDDYKDCYTFFLQDEDYGRSVRILKEKEQTLAEFGPAIEAGLCIPQAHGELVLYRQSTLLQCLVIMIDDILEGGSKTRKQRRQTAKPAEPDSNLTLRPKPTKQALPDVLMTARDQLAALEERLSLVTSEPLVLAHDVNICFFTRPELVPDEKGRSLGVHTDKYISGAVLDAVHGAVRATAIWRYIEQLLERLSQTPDKTLKPIVLQELANTCNLEYERAQQAFKRAVQTGTGMKWFKRVYGVYDKSGNARVTIKGKPDDLMAADPQLFYMLRLCQQETTAAKAADWLRELHLRHTSHPEDRQKLDSKETEALGNLEVIVSFISDLASVVSVPTPSRKKGQMFISRAHDLEAELKNYKKNLDLLDFAVPIDNLLEPGMADGALKALDDFIVAKSGVKLGFLYQDLILDSLAELERQHQEAKSKSARTELPPPAPLVIPEQPEERIQHRREKEKTRPTASKVFEITPSTKSPEVEKSAEDGVVTPKLEVKPATAQVFATLFDKSRARGSISWADFTAAMTALKFSVIPKLGSVFAFYPPSADQKPLTLHRPHGSHIEGYLLPVYAQRLKRAYGWDKDSFTVV
ncbi:hypothetical protein QBC47DRAFT_328954 [Echria macrotheca]|uniref:Ipa protein n=1 Tax=Echria macrotheca TaxID=438768 RepID=A0AAJ0F6E6_9PEZI|nr:hypothetical protein QBC47DRAFT_328954 [Echria macrotheca]